MSKAKTPAAAQPWVDKAEGGGKKNPKAAGAAAATEPNADGNTQAAAQGATGTDPATPAAPPADNGAPAAAGKAGKADKAPEVKTVRMCHNETGQFADVHPLEVENYRLGGFDKV